MTCFKRAVSLCAVLLSTTAVSDNTKQTIADVPYNWNGFYVGVNAGAVKHTINMTDNQAVTFNATIQQVTNPSVIGGLQAGFRQQLSPAAITGVWGAEISTDFSNARSHKEFGSPFALYQLGSSNQLRNVSMLEMTFGIAADKSMLFVAAGLAGFDVSGNVRNEDGIPFFNGFSISKNELAAAIGCGAEYAFTSKLSARLKVDVLIPNTYSTFDNVGNSYDVANDIVLGTIGVNYRIG